MNVNEAQAFLNQMLQDAIDGIKVRGTCQCQICGGRADLHACGLHICSVNGYHQADTFLGMFTDLTPPPLEPDRYT